VQTLMLSPDLRGGGGWMPRAVFLAAMLLPFAHLRYRCKLCCVLFRSPRPPPPTMVVATTRSANTQGVMFQLVISSR